MEKGLRIFLGAIGLFWRYRGFALRVCLPLYLLAVVIAMMLDLAGLIPLDPYAQAPDDGGDGAHDDVVSFWQMVGYGALWTGTVVLMAVLWHRHVLAAQGIAPTAALSWRQPLVYGGKAFAIISLTSFLPLAVLVVVLITFDVDPSWFESTVVPSLRFPPFSIGVGTILIWAAMRLSLALPAAALGHRSKVFESWVTTRPIAGALWVPALLEALLSMAVSEVVTGLAGRGGYPAYLVLALVYWVVTMLSISILTLLYDWQREWHGSGISGDRSAG